MYKEAEQEKTFAPDSWYGRTCPEHSAPTVEPISEPSCKKPSGLQNRKLPLFLCLSVDGRWQDASLVRGGSGPSHGAYLMHSFGESPNAAAVSRLSQILEADAPLKYYLSEKACLGIIRRAERRGKKLPPMLEKALLLQGGKSENIVNQMPPQP